MCVMQEEKKITFTAAIHANVRKKNAMLLILYLLLAFSFS